MLGAICRLNVVQFHDLLRSQAVAYETTFTRYDTLLIMPRTAGVSCNSETELTLRRPKPRTVARWLSRVPIRPLTNLTLIVFAISSTLAQNFFDRLAALGSDFRWRIHLRQSVQGRTHHIVGIGRSIRFGNHVCDAHYFEDRAHRAASNDTSTIFSRRHQN